MFGLTDPYAAPRRDSTGESIARECGDASLVFTRPRQHYLFSLLRAPAIARIFAVFPTTKHPPLTDQPGSGSFLPLPFREGRAMPTSYHISENRMYPMLKAEQDLVAFLLSLDRQFGGFERGLLSSLSKQRNENGIPVISVKQRVSLWKIPKRFHIPEIENFQHKEILEVVIFLMVAINSVHDSCWASAIANEHKKKIEESLHILAGERTAWFEERLNQLWEGETE